MAFFPKVRVYYNGRRLKAFVETREAAERIASRITGDVQIENFGVEVTGRRPDGVSNWVRKQGFSVWVKPIPGMSSFF